MSKRKVTFSLDSDVVETLKMMSALTSEEKSSIVACSLRDFFEKIGARSGKTAEEFVSFMKEARAISKALKPDSVSKSVPHSQLPDGSGEETHSALPGDIPPEESFDQAL